MAHVEPQGLLVRIAELLHAYGTPAHRFEAHVRNLAGALGLQVQVSFAPTMLLMEVHATGSDDAAQTFVRRVEPGGVDLGRLAALNDLIAKIVAGEVSPTATARRLDAIVRAPRRSSRLTMLVASGLASGSAAVLFGGGQREAFVAGLLGVAIALLAAALERDGVVSPLFEPLAALLAAVGSRAASWAGLVHVDGISTLAALIVLLPGLSLSLALVELATRHLVSGTARLTGAIATFLSLAFGVAVGRSLIPPLTDAAPSVADPVSLLTIYMATATAGAAFAVLFSVRPRETIWVVAAGIVAVAGAQLGTHWLGPQLGAFVGAVVVGLLGNLYTLRTGGPSMVVLIPGLLVLVPGSIGLRALNLLMVNDVVAGMQAAFETLLVATSLAAGISVAASLLPQTLRQRT